MQIGFENLPEIGRNLEVFASSGDRASARPRYAGVLGYPAFSTSFAHLRWAATRLVVGFADAGRANARLP